MPNIRQQLSFGRKKRNGIGENYTKGFNFICNGLVVDEPLPYYLLYFLIKNNQLEKQIKSLYIVIQDYMIFKILTGGIAITVLQTWLL